MSKQANTVILARVSSKSQEDEGYSLDSQLKLLKGYCEKNDLTVVKEFKITETASKEQSRKIFHELLTYMKNKKVYHLAVEKTDRLTRNLRDAVAIDDWLNNDKDRRLHAVKESLILHKEAKSDVKFMWNIYVAVAKKYTDTLREEAMKGWAEKLAQGWLPAPPPVGYMTVILNGKRIHLPNSDIVPLVQHIFEYYLLPGESIASVCLEMKRIGLTTRKGRPFSKSHVQKILTNPFYIGINRHNGKEYPGAQESIIRKDIFNRVQDKMRRKTAGSRYRQHNPVFKNIISCSNCGRLVTWQLQKGHYYGACQRTSETCKAYKFLREDKLENDVVDLLKSLVCPSQEIIAWVAEALKERHQTSADKNAKLAESIQTQIDRLKRMDDNLYDDKLAGDISQDRYQEKHTEITNEVGLLEERLGKIDYLSSRRLERKLVLLELSQKAAQIFPSKTPDQKRLVISKLFDNLTYHDGVVSVNYTKFSKTIAQNVKLTHQIIGGAK